MPYCGCTIFGAFAHPTGMHPLSLREVLLSALALVGQYFAILFLPARLSAFHPFHASTSMFDASSAGGALALGLSAGVFGSPLEARAAGCIWNSVAILDALLRF